MRACARGWRCGEATRSTTRCRASTFDSGHKPEEIALRSRLARPARASDRFLQAQRPGVWDGSSWAPVAWRCVALRCVAVRCHVSVACAVTSRNERKPSAYCSLREGFIIAGPAPGRIVSEPGLGFPRASSDSLRVHRARSYRESPYGTPGIGKHTAPVAQRPPRHSVGTERRFTARACDDVYETLE